MSYVGFARQFGVLAFWVETPPPSSTRSRNLHWADSNGNAFHYPVNECASAAQPSPARA